MKAKTLITSLAIFLALIGATGLQAASELKNVNERTREEKIKIFTDKVFGRRPVERPAHLTFTPASPDCEMLGGAAVRRQVRITYGGTYGTNSFVATAFLPKNVKKPVPAFLLICNRATRKYADVTRKTKHEFWPVEEIIARGYATVMFHNGDVAPDRNIGFTEGVYGCFEDVTRQYRDLKAWGALSAWAWGASRVMDWIETEPRIDRTKVAVIGHSRGGKTALWAAATDTRFAYACINNSGCTGAKLHHLDLPKSEHIAIIVKVNPHWLCADYVDCVNRDMELDFDHHELISCVAPRLVAVGSAAEDFPAGPEGERLATELASEAWTDKGRVHYHCRAGRHALLLSDWTFYLDHAKANGW